MNQYALTYLNKGIATRRDENLQSEATLTPNNLQDSNNKPNSTNNDSLKRVHWNAKLKGSLNETKSSQSAGLDKENKRVKLNDF